MSDDERQAILEAIELLDVKKRELVHEDLDAWFVLCHAKLYLQGLLEP